MHITKYGVSYHCGYGVLAGYSRGSYMDDLLRFHTNVNLIANNQGTYQSKVEMRWESKAQQSIIYPIYLVFDEDTKCWYEYFSGRKINYLISTSSYNTYKTGYPEREIKGTVYSNLSEWRPENIVNYYRALDDVSVFKELTFVEVGSLLAADFASQVSKINDDQIKTNVSAINAFIDEAPKWIIEFEKAFKELREDSNRKMSELADIESRIAANFKIND